MADFSMEGMEKIQENLKKINSKMNRLENKALRAGANVFKEAIEKDAPRSSSPRQPSKGTQRWRTGKHAADNIKVGNVKRTKGGDKIILVGVQKKDNSKYFYLKFHEWGTSKMPARPFMEPAKQSKQAEARAAVAAVLKEGLGL